MSTRSTTHFMGYGKPGAIIYRHSDGYPEGAGTDIFRFFAAVEAQTEDTRFDDVSYLAAKYVVFLADMFARTLEKVNGEYQYVKGNQLDFLSVGVCMTDPGDIEYRYLVNCDEHDSQGWPTVTCVQLNQFSDDPEEVVSIPLPDAS